MRVPDIHNKYDILKHAQEEWMRTRMHIFQSSHIDKYGDIGLLLIQLSHISVSADGKDYCSISISSTPAGHTAIGIHIPVIYTYIYMYILVCTYL